MNHLIAGWGARPRVRLVRPHRLARVAALALASARLAPPALAKRAVLPLWHLLV